MSVNAICTHSIILKKCCEKVIVREKKNANKTNIPILLILNKTGNEFTLLAISI